MHNETGVGGDVNAAEIFFFTKKNSARLSPAKVIHWWGLVRTYTSVLWFNSWIPSDHIYVPDLRVLLLNATTHAEAKSWAWSLRVRYPSRIQIWLPTIFRDGPLREQGCLLPSHSTLQKQKSITAAATLLCLLVEDCIPYEPCSLCELDGTALQISGASSLHDDHERGWPSPESYVPRSVLVHPV